MGANAYIFNRHSIIPCRMATLIGINPRLCFPYSNLSHIKRFIKDIMDFYRTNCIYPPRKKGKSRRGGMGIRT
jgi:hypothetical protein